MTHMVCWYPTYSESEAIFKTLSEKSKYIEVQFPFSDPIADGTVLELANKVALAGGMTTQKCFDFVEKVGNVWKCSKIIKNTIFYFVLCISSIIRIVSFL